MHTLADEAIHGFLAAPKPADFDDFMKVVGSALNGIVPALRDRAAGFHTGLDVDDIVSRTVELAIGHLIGQWHGRDTKFEFLPKHQLSFKSWLEQILGRPGAGPRSGVIGEMIQERKRRAVVIDPNVDLDLVVSSFASAADERDERVDYIEFAVSRLPSYDQFVIRAAFGLHSFGDLDQTTIPQLARQAGFDGATIRKIARRAKGVRRDNDASSATLARTEIGLLLDLGDRQVGNIKVAGLDRLTTAYAQMQ
jgi:hypothetical protein